MSIRECSYCGLEMLFLTEETKKQREMTVTSLLGWVITPDKKLLKTRGHSKGPQGPRTGELSYRTVYLSIAFPKGCNPEAPNRKRWEASLYKNIPIKKTK